MPITLTQEQTVGLISAIKSGDDMSKHIAVMFLEHCLEQEESANDGNQSDYSEETQG